jgi:DNA helicase II / ATP-dependent DNA helicase PcrA
VNLNQMLETLEKLPGRQVQVTKEQRAVIEHETGPLWVIAGPGSGKTEVLVLRCLKLVCVEKLTPASIIITTFTERAAKNIEDRMALYKEYLAKSDPSLRQVDLARVRVGTLHSLCNDIMQEYRYPDYQNVRLLDEMEQPLFVYEHSILAATNAPANQRTLWDKLDYLVDRWDPISGKRWNRAFMPSRWRRAHAAVILFNHIAEDMLDVANMKSKGGVWRILADAYEEYLKSLKNHFRCDFAHVQKRFLEFLNTPRGAQFLNGEGTPEHAGIRHVLVDEYQDTNFIQEAIYLRMAASKPHTLTVVGDDDQALYRFRGATVECMVTFDKACQRAWNVPVKSIRQLPLMGNFRSHSRIVEWCSDYIESFDLMGKPGARAPRKPRLSPQSSIRGNHPSVALLTRNNVADLADAFAQLVRGLLDNGIVQKPSDCALLMKSTRENSRWAGPYVDALRGRNILTYNPRSKALLQQEEVMAALGGLVEVLDPEEKAQAAVYGDGIQNMATGWRTTYRGLARNNSNLARYVTSARQRIAAIPKNQLIMLSGPTGALNFPATLQELFYHLLNHEPFKTWLDDPERTVRLGTLTKAIEAYCSNPVPGRDAPTRGFLRTSTQTAGEVNFNWRQNFYYALVGLLVTQGLDEPEDEEEFFPPDRLPVMTVHQVKGLEFPFVFVGGASEDPEPSAAHLLEDELLPFRQTAPASQPFNAAERALQDLARFYYVAYSRAQYALIMLARTSQVNQARPAFGGRGKAWYRQRVTIL